MCPQNAKEIAGSTEKVKMFLSCGEQVIVSIAPSFIANYDGAGILSIEEALKKLGFHSAEETAIGATVVKKEYENMIRNKKSNIIISSCCHSVNLLIKKHFAFATEYLADVVSPMVAHCIDIKQRHPGAKTVFIGPCVSKKAEALLHKQAVDCVLTFEELTNWMYNENITLSKQVDTLQESRARLFPIAGGILKTMDCDGKDYDYISIDGVENCIAALNDIAKGNIANCFIAMSACTGSCICGPTMEKVNRSPVHYYQKVTSYAGEKDFDVKDLPAELISIKHKKISTNAVIPTVSQMQEILKQMCKTRPEHELNCGTCGYNTCREKALAIFQGKADLSICLPFLKERAESFSNNIINNSPNGIIILNEGLEVQQINKAACKIMNIRYASDMLGEQVVRVLDPKDFISVRNSGKSINDKRVYLAEYGKYVEENIIYDAKYSVIMCLMRDVTDEETEREKKESISRKTIDIADKVVDKQMRVVQEIASLLGETAAETKIALTKLKESISDE